MPSISKQCRGKRARVLIKRTCRLGSHSRAKTHPLYGKLKSNNNSLAKALSRQKQDNRKLVSQNIELNAQVLALRHACNKRDAIISNVQNKAKEILNMLVTITNYVTNTIIICQEFASVTDTNVRTSTTPLAKRDSSVRLSIKSPTRGVVKPMVSGHTITKPTINLSRINMQHFNNMANLNIIEETTTPRTSPTVTDTRAVSVAINKKRLSYGNRRRCKLPERIPLTSLTVDDEDEERISNRKRSSGQHSKNSVRLPTDDITRCSGNQRIGSPRVALCDVSKLLQNLQSPNIRKSRIDPNNEEINKNHKYKTATCRKINSNVLLPEGQASTNSEQTRDLETTDNVTSTWKSPKSNETYGRINYRTHNCKNNVSAWEDPLEGPSWLLNDQQKVLSSNDDSEICMKICTKDIQLKETQSSNESMFSKHPFSFASPIISIQENILNETMEFTECINKVQAASDCLSTEDRDDQQNVPAKSDSNNDATLTVPSSIDLEKNKHDDEAIVDDVTQNKTCFITKHRGKQPVDDDMEDFTLMYHARRQAQNTQFNIDDLQLPILEPADLNISEPQNTTLVHRITQKYPTSTLSNSSTDQFMFDHSTIDLPIIPDPDEQTGKLSPPKKRQLDVQEDKEEISISMAEPLDNIIVSKKKSSKKKKILNNKDPSAVKVVLQKLNESHVKKSSSSKKSRLRESEYSTGDSVSSRTLNFENSDETIINRSIHSIDVSSQSQSKKTSSRKSRLTTKDTNETDGSSSTCSEPVICRTMRQKPLINFKEPSLNKKLRRNM